MGHHWLGNGFVASRSQAINLTNDEMMNQFIDAQMFH